MSDAVKPISESEDKPTSTLNGQLATPSLSPIRENGGDVIQPFPALEPGENGYFNNRNQHNAELSPGRIKPTVIERRTSSTSSIRTNKLSPTQLHELVHSPDSIPIRAVEEKDADVPPLDFHDRGRFPAADLDGSALSESGYSTDHGNISPVPSNATSVNGVLGGINEARANKSSRSVSSPLLPRKQSSSRPTKIKPQLAPIKTDNERSDALNGTVKHSPSENSQVSPAPSLIPLPPLSLPTYLQLELSSNRPSALYIHRSSTADSPYESSRVKFERLQNFLLLPLYLEQILWFGAIACLDAWLYTFTILPLRFLKAIAILAQWWGQTLAKETRDMSLFVYQGLGRVWQRRLSTSRGSRRISSAPHSETSRRPSVIDITSEAGRRMNNLVAASATDRRSRKSTAGFRHRRTRSTPSALLPNHKADILQGLLIAISCAILMWLDASRMYHSIRGQAAIKLYVIYNVLEVFDRLFSAIGQDVLECLFSKETLERDEYGRSKIFRPLWMFLLALVYNVVHATALFYQVVTLNVAVNSYSNALLTLLMSNQFVEIKGTVFKKFEKENLFQLTCADVVERFQLWLMLLIIALRNIVEVGGLSISLNSAFGNPTTPGSASSNATSVPFISGSLIPKSFTLFPKWTGEVLGPFLIVLGSEALVDWCKHAYINKFNNVKPNIYGRFLDILAKDYYAHAFADQNLTKRLGLPVIPLSCLFIRACVQTYHMFLATHMPLPIASSATGISVESEAAATSPSTTAALQHIDHVFRRALGRSSFGAGGDSTSSLISSWGIDDVIAFVTMAIFFLALYFVLLAFKLILGMSLMSFARSRYRGMKERERHPTETQGRRVGGWGMVEVSEDKRRWIYDDDPEGLSQLREKEKRQKKSDRGEHVKLEGVDRYSMVAKRIW